MFGLDVAIQNTEACVRSILHCNSICHFGVEYGSQAVEVSEVYSCA